MIFAAAIFDAEYLTEIALTSKAYWGYSNHLITHWRKDLTVTSKMIEEKMVFKFIYDKKIAGFYVLNKPIKQTIELEMLFVLPSFIGKGIGKQLLQHSLEKARKLNLTTMTLLADPFAMAFYASRGFYKIDKKESAIVGRFLPVMKIDLAKQ